MSDEEQSRGELIRLAEQLQAHAEERPPVPFTWEDVDDIREAAEVYSSTFGCRGPDAYEGRLRNLADRIASLLPPRETPP